MKKKYGMELAVLLIALLSGCSATDYLQGDYTRRRGDADYMRRYKYQSAAEQYREASALNDRFAMLRYGQMCLRGDAACSTEEGIESIRRAAAERLTEAQTYIGMVYLYGWHGVQPDSKLALPYLEEAAAQNDPYALMALASAYGGSFSIPRQPLRTAEAYACLLENNWPVEPELTSSMEIERLVPGRVVCGVQNDEPTVRQAQTYLKQLGYFRGEPSGKIDSATRRAIFSFRADHKRADDGKISFGLVRELNTALFFPEDPYLLAHHDRLQDMSPVRSEYRESLKRAFRSEQSLMRLWLRRLLALHARQVGLNRSDQIVEKSEDSYGIFSSSLRKNASSSIHGTDVLQCINSIEMHKYNMMQYTDALNRLDEAERRDLNRP
ncbi:MAG: peptidoglycan-binding protein [Desulfovibrionaceae bacterium]|nr:peptidoglycan-binding protein [Desulfovibrionaceae bacterium]